MCDIAVVEGVQEDAAAEVILQGTAAVPTLVAFGCTPRLQAAMRLGGLPSAAAGYVCLPFYDAPFLTCHIAVTPPICHIMPVQLHLRAQLCSTLQLDTCRAVSGSNSFAAGKISNCDETVLAGHGSSCRQPCPGRGQRGRRSCWHPFRSSGAATPQMTWYPCSWSS